jgi:Kdo2-lipid IVA lauroyltransferase/acyltransferase
MSRSKSKVLQRLEYAAYRSVAALVRRASEESLRRWGSRLGAFSRRVLRRRDRLAMRNLRTAFPEKPELELRRTLDECWHHFGREMLAFVRAQSMSLEEIARSCPFVNAGLIEEARSRGKGVVLISAHYGGWEIAGLAVTALVDDVRTVTRPLDNEFLERDLARLRARTGVVVVDRRRAARALLRGLSENAVVVLLPDQAVLPREGILVPFLGRDAWTTDAPAKIALRHGTTIVFTFCIPEPTGHRLEFEEPIRVDQLSEAERDPVALTRRINDVISRRIASRPELWLWMHDRWKGTGESEAADGN